MMLIEAVNKADGLYDGQEYGKGGWKTTCMRKERSRRRDHVADEYIETEAVGYQ